MQSAPTQTVCCQQCPNVENQVSYAGRVEKKITCFVKVLQVLSANISQQRLLNGDPAKWIHSAYGKLSFSPPTSFQSSYCPFYVFKLRKGVILQARLPCCSLRATSYHHTDSVFPEAMPQAKFTVQRARDLSQATCRN